MARRSLDHAEVFRIKIEHPDDQYPYTEFQGPYATLAAAKGRMTEINRSDALRNPYRSPDDHRVTATIQSSTVTWEDVPE